MEPGLPQPPLPPATGLGAGLRLLALAVALAPLLLQTATLVLTGSLLATALAGGLLAVAIAAAGLVAQRQLAGTVGAVAGDSVLWLLLAVLVYNALAFVFACAAYVLLFAPA
jgi:hypothetical protein